MGNVVNLYPQICWRILFFGNPSIKTRRDTFLVINWFQLWHLEWECAACICNFATKRLEHDHNMLNDKGIKIYDNTWQGPQVPDFHSLLVVNILQICTLRMTVTRWPLSTVYFFVNFSADTRIFKQFFHIIMIFQAWASRCWHIYFFSVDCATEFSSKKSIAYSFESHCI